MSQDVANEFGPRSEFHLAAGMCVAQGMSTEKGCHHARFASVFTQDFPNDNRTDKSIVRHPPTNEEMSRRGVNRSTMAQIARQSPRRRRQQRQRELNSRFWPNNVYCSGVPVDGIER